MFDSKLNALFLAAALLVWAAIATATVANVIAPPSAEAPAALVHA